MAKIPIILEPGRADGKLATSGAIFDENKNKFQNKINEEVEERLNDVKDTLNSDSTTTPLSAKQGKVLKNLLDSKAIEAGTIPIDSEPTEGNITHIVNSDGLAKEFKKHNTAIIKGSVYDVSFYNNGAIFESIQALLSSSNLDTLIPKSVRHGGMSIRFIQSSDNKYVQFRYMETDTTTAATFTNVANWQSMNVDDEPTAGSNNLVKSGGVYNSTPTIENSDTESDLDISDENGNVIARFAGGHIQVKNFSSTDVLNSIQAILSNVGFDNIPEFSKEEDYAIGNIVRYEKYVYVFISEHTAGEWNETEVEKTVINTEHPVDVADSKNESDLYISDEEGNVLVRFENGHIQTKNFSSVKNNANIGIDSIKAFNEETDYSIGNIVKYDRLLYKFIVAHTAGEWNTEEVEQTSIIDIIEESTDYPIDVETDNRTNDLDIADDNGYVLARFEGGHIRTKNFNSRTIGTQDSILAGKTISFLGDSITQQGYYINNLEKLASITSLRYGISGTTIAAKSVNDDNTCFEKRVDSMSSSTNAVFVMGGTNDFGHKTDFANDYSFGNINDGNSSKNTFCAGVHRLFRKLYNKFEKNGIPVIIVTPLHIGSSYAQLNKEYTYNTDNTMVEGVHNITNKTFKEYVDTILDIASYYSFKTIDLYRESGMNPYINSALFQDGLHPNNAGGLKMAKYLKVKLTEILQQYN